jgi:serine/threonine protein kinase
VHGFAKSYRRESTMTPELWQRLKPLFHAALEKDTQNRASFVDAACGQDFELKLRLEELLEAEQQDTGSLDVPLAHLNGFLDDNKARFQPGELVLGRFRIIRPIGKGGMGEVYEAEDLQLGIVALKTIRHGIASSSDAFERFRQEVQLARRVSGPEVCRIHELYLLPASGKHKATAFLTMEYLEGITLHEKIQRDGPQPWKEAMNITLEICEGLRLIHEKGIIHRDLKSGNIMLCKQGGVTRVVLMDFGLARDFDLDAFKSGTPSSAKTPGKTLPQMIMGTPEYMAPEQFEAKPVSPATDIYALGIILYELVTGLHPYAADTPVAAAIRRAKLPQLPSSLRPKVPGQCDRIIERCLEYDPEKRFQSAKEVAKALRAGPANIENLKKDRPWVLWLASAVVLGLIAGSTFFFWQSRQYYRPSAEALRWYDTGVASLREGNNVKATRSLQEAVSQDSHFVMAHARLAEAWANLDFDGNAQREFLLASPGGRHLEPLDRMYLDAIHATVTKDSFTEIATYRQILNLLPPHQKASGYVDLGMAYERAGDPAKALEDYKQAASLDKYSPAPFMRTAVLQSRLHHVPEADRAFQRTQELLSTEMNQEGLAELDYERGYAINAAGDPALAERYLQKALEEAKAIPSVQLQIRTLTQLSQAAYTSDRYGLAVKHAEEAIHLAQSNQLDLWAADGFVRLANAELQQGDLQKAEDAVREALQLSGQSQQRRIEAGANLTLASIMSQRQLPDQVIAPAQSAQRYFTQNGFRGPATSASLLLIRTQRDKGEYSQALESGKAFQDFATKSGSRQLMAMSAEVVGTVYLKMEQYPAALERFQNALSEADGTNAKAYQALHCADTLWRLGRYAESDEVLRSVPDTEKFDFLLTQIRLASLLSRMKYREADALAQQKLANQSTMAADSKQQLELDDALAVGYLQMKPAALKCLEEVSGGASNTALDWDTQLGVAEVNLALGNAEQALDGATKAAEHFAAKNQLNSELRSLYIAASASKILNNAVASEQFSKKTVDILSQLQQTWDPQALQSYMSRPDLQALMRGASVSAPFDRR